jgi:hypothetical protein
MERFRFGEQEGANGRITTFNGSVQVEPDYPDPRFCAVVTLGPSGGERSRMIIDKATARKLGAALMKWAGEEKPKPYCDDCADERNLPFPLNHRVYGICPFCGEGERFVNEF